MISKTKIALAAAIVLSTAVSASAATTHRATHVKRSAIYDVVSNYNSCPPSGGPSCSDACLPSGPPCKTEPDGW
jgi:uncharacterized membrane protein